MTRETIQIQLNADGTAHGSRYLRGGNIPPQIPGWPKPYQVFIEMVERINQIRIQIEQRSGNNQG